MDPNSFQNINRLAGPLNMNSDIHNTASNYNRIQMNNPSSSLATPLDLQIWKVIFKQV